MKTVEMIFIKIYCPILKKDVEILANDIYWNGEQTLEIPKIYIHVTCKCGESHKIEIY